MIAEVKKVASFQNPREYRDWQIKMLEQGEDPKLVMDKEDIVIFDDLGKEEYIAFLKEVRREMDRGSEE